MAKRTKKDEPEWVKQLKRFRDLEERGYEDDSLTEAEVEELHRLMAEFEQRRLPVLPTCCESAQKSPIVKFSVWTMDRPSWDPQAGRWYTARLEGVFRSEGYDFWKNGPTPVKFCAYCGTALPVMVLKANPPEPLRRIGIDGDYCETCGERHDCQCWPPEAAFEPSPPIP